MSVDNSSDFEKLTKALTQLTGSFASVDDMLAAFGLANMPMAQRYGILVGTCVFTITIATVGFLLLWGGSFQRIAEQSQTGDSTIAEPTDARKKRALLLERLLEGRGRMITENTSGEKNVLTRRLENVACRNVDVPELVEGKSQRKSGENRYVPPGYEKNYAIAYRRCQDKPGGPILSGRPEARFEAYARAYAGCGLYTSTAYRRSYARMYESLCCATHGSDDKYREIFERRPQDIVGRSVRLETLAAERHLKALYDCTCGLGHGEHPEFDPNKVWGFLDYGPFASKEALGKSSLFHLQPGECAFGIVENVTDRLLGVVMLTNDNPKNLNIDIEPPIVKPKSMGTVEQLEACFLVMDRLFSLGYRRINMLIDSKDAATRKLPGRLGMTQEGLLPKHMIIKEASRDSAVYGMLNSDWDNGARKALFKKIYGTGAQRFDSANEAKENELEEQGRKLKAIRASEKETVSKT